MGFDTLEMMPFNFSLNRNGQCPLKGYSSDETMPWKLQRLNWEFFLRQCAGPKAPAASYCFLEVTVQFLPVCAAPLHGVA